MNKDLKIYFFGSIWGAESDKEITKGLLSHLKKRGNVLSEHLFSDDYAKKEKLRYYDNVPKIKGKNISADEQGYTSPNIDETKPLTVELKHFLDCVRNNKEPLTGGKEALITIKILEHAQKSLDNRGKEVEVRL